MKSDLFDNSMYDFDVLRDLRRREGLSIADVSGRSGVSAAVISKLERNQTLPGLDTLYRVGRVFGLNPSEVLQLAEKQSAHRLRAESHSANGFTFTEIRYGNVRCLKGIALAGSSLSRPEIHGDDYEVCWVLEGCIEFQLPNEVHLLRAGEALQFDAILHHSYKALEKSKFLIVQMRKDKRF